MITTISTLKVAENGGFSERANEINFLSRDTHRIFLMTRVLRNKTWKLMSRESADVLHREILGFRSPICHRQS